MADFLFQQRFSAGDVERLPFDELVGVLREHGAPRRVEGGVEIDIGDDAVADALFLVGDAAAGAGCVAVLGPRYGEALRKLAWRCIDEFGCAAFDDTLTRLFVPAKPGHDSALALPAPMREVADTVLRRVSSPGQLWPAWAEMSIEAPDRYALLRPASGNVPAIMQAFDQLDAASNLMQVNLVMLPQACNEGTVGALRLLQQRVDLVLDAHPKYSLAYRYADPETPLQEAEFPATPAAGPPSRPVTIITPFPGEHRPRPRFASDRELFASVSEQGRLAVETARAEFGIALDGTAPGVHALAGLLDKLHRGSSSAQQEAHTAKWAIRAGSYLALVLCRKVGGQIGYTTHDATRFPCVRMHSGRLQFPVLRVLDHIVNGGENDDGIGAWFDAVARQDASPTPREQDWVCNIPGYCDILLGRANLTGGKLPLEEEIRRDRLDFSVASLEFLDAYLAKVRALPAVERKRVGGQVAVIAGAYLGEVVRSHARDTWTWVPYDDHAAANPGFAAQRPRQDPLLAFLDSDEQTCYPIAHVASLLDGAIDASCQAFAAALETPAATAAGALEAPVDDGDPAFCPSCAHPMLSTTTACERCGAQFSEAGNWRPLPQLAMPADELPAQAQGVPGSSAATLSRWLLRAGHVCLVGPILHFGFVAVIGTAPIDAVANLFAFAPFFYVAGGLLTLVARGQVAAISKAKRDGTQLKRFVEGPWDMMEYENLPVGLQVTHEPAKGPAVRNGPSGQAFSWICKTSVAAIRQQVQLQAFCGTHWREGRWVPANAAGKPFTGAEFEQWYACPQARLQTGQSYADNSNWSGAGELRRSMTRWCYVGVTDDGLVVRGDATVHHAAALDPTQG